MSRASSKRHPTYHDENSWPAQQAHPFILQMMRREGWTFPADIELEYKVPQDSDARAEVKKCVQFCRECLA